MRLWPRLLLVVVCAWLGGAARARQQPVRHAAVFSPLWKIGLPNVRPIAVDADRLRHRLQSLDPNDATVDADVLRRVREALDTRATAHQQRLATKLFERRLIGRDGDDHAEWLWTMFAGDAKLMIDRLAEFV